MDNIFEDKEDGLYKFKMAIAVILIILSLAVSAYLANRALRRRGVKTTVMYVTKSGAVIVERHIRR